MAELATGDTGRKTEVADRNLLVDIGIGEVVRALGHSTNEDANTLIVVQLVDVAPHSYYRSVKTESDFSALGWQVVGDGVLDDAEQLLLRGRGLNGQTVEQLDHQPSKALECARNANRGRNFDQHTLGGGDVDLEPTGLVDRRVEEGEQALTGSTYVSHP